MSLFLAEEHDPCASPPSYALVLAVKASYVSSERHIKVRVWEICPASRDRGVCQYMSCICLAGLTLGNRNMPHEAEQGAVDRVNGLSASRPYSCSTSSYCGVADKYHRCLNHQPAGKIMALVSLISIREANANDPSKL